MRDDPAVEAWIAKAKAMPVEAGLLGRDIAWRNAHAIAERCGPCPACGGHDRFSVNTVRGVWNCRGARGGRDAISLARHVAGLTFLEAVEELTGEPKPDGQAMSAERRAQLRREHERRQREAATRAARREKESDWYRERERIACWKIWREGIRISGTPTEAYLAHRGILPLTGALLRHHPSLAYFHPDTKLQLHRGPAMLAAILGPDGKFAGLHMTYLDPRLVDGALPREAKGKLQIADGETGEILPAKKVRGSSRRGHIHLGRFEPARFDARRLVIGEGIETVGSVRVAERAAERLPATLYWSSIDLGNLGGRSVGTMRHPTLKRVDKRGRESAIRVRDAEPDLAHPGIPLPLGIKEVVILGDGDSDPFATRQTLKRAAARFSAEALGEKPCVRIAYAAAGWDFNDMWRADAWEAPASEGPVAA
ncbi:hypothetical protein SAMN05519104_6688 [Rhizobiales bacterium GAS188]|nr:hypothetical protein SAMN05519104_6688 [Rhizobiales bacterium GAS188]